MRFALEAANPGKEEFKRRAEQAKQELYRQERAQSRLYIVDAGLDVESLRARYEDRARYAIVRGQVSLSVERVDNKKYLSGHVGGVSIGSVNVPFMYRSIFEPLLKAPYQREQERAPRYDVEVAFGKRLEPWITAVSIRTP